MEVADWPCTRVTLGLGLSIALSSVEGKVLSLGKARAVVLAPTNAKLSQGGASGPLSLTPLLTCLDSLGNALPILHDR